MPRLLPATSTCILNTRVVSQRYIGVPSSDHGTVGVELGKRMRSETKTDKEYEMEQTFMESAYTSCCDNVLVATDPHSLILHVNEQLEPYTPNRPVRTVIGQRGHCVVCGVNFILPYSYPFPSPK